MKGFYSSNDGRSRTPGGRNPSWKFIPDGATVSAKKVNGKWEATVTANGHAASASKKFLQDGLLLAVMQWNKEEIARSGRASDLAPEQD